MTTAAAARTEIDQAIMRAGQTAQRWAAAAEQYSATRAAQLLGQALKDADGLDYTVQFVDKVIRPEDLSVAARNLAELAKRTPAFLPSWLKAPARLGGVSGRLLPSVTIPAARYVFRQLVGDLVIDVTDEKLGPAIARLREDGSRLNVNLLGEAVLGDKEAARRLADTFKLLQRDDVDYVSLKVSAVTGPHNPWAHAEVVAEAVERLAPLYDYAAAQPTPKFINLDMEEYRDLDMTIEVFTKLLDRDNCLHLRAGIVLQAYLPDALPAMQRLQEWAASRRARGGAPIKVRVVKGANLAMERVAAEEKGWELVTWESKTATDANYLRVLEWALTPQRMDAVHIGVAGHNLFTLAFAWELAGLRGAREHLDVEMLAGMATPQAAAVRQDVGDLLLYVPVVRPAEYDVAIAYLVRRLEENAAPENFMASIFDIGHDTQAFAKEAERFARAADMWQAEGERRVRPTRQQDRSSETADQLTAAQQDADGRWRFANTPDSDPALPANQRWARQILARVPDSRLGEQTVAEAWIGAADVADVLARATAAGQQWAARPARERAELLHRVGVELARRRGELIEVAAAELGKGLDQADVEVSEAVDFAHYYAERSRELEQLSGATFTPARVTLVTPPWNFPLAIPFGGVAAALAAGCAVVLKPAPTARRCAALIAECLWAAGVPREVMQFVVGQDEEIGQPLVTDPRVERVVLTGASDTAEMFRSWRPDLPLLAETSGKNAIIVTPSADLDLAVKDVVYSAFGHAGQKCSAASLVILVGSAARSKRFKNQLVDAVQSLVVDWPTNPRAQVGPLSELPGDKLTRGLTVLEEGQNWVVRPRQLDDSGRLWSPGVRAGVNAGSEFHLVEYFGPVLGVMRATTLAEAVELQNATQYGLTAGLHSLDAKEINYWLDHVQAGNVYVNRGITGAIVQRQPFGGWKRSAVGNGTKAGGPNYLLAFGTVTPAERTGGEEPLTKPQLRELSRVALLLLEETVAVGVARDLADLERACLTEFDVLHDPTGNASERNILRYLPACATVRAEADAPLADIVRSLGAALAQGSFEFNEREDGTRITRQAGASKTGVPQLLLSTATPVPEALAEFARRYGLDVRTESAEEFRARTKRQLAAPEPGAPAQDVRVRLLGGSGAQLLGDLGGSIDVAVWADPVTHCGRVEILPFVHEQAVSITNHRFGNPTPLTRQVLA
ncbi:aldehyde dehydrogenase family protein [Buchananella hordeovulneris]|uniref:bifunctional proline dehydrogenase/L-glutamate gamma-semialdehyde dehydrogenase n=1 Tax=Buchananella hordeovulneris TaxID=52770 RepID=UPI000F5E01FC|nr:bifunctional proline dehydrogenase/L-glutamate gamma-semialdehyde dehydrogenase [Buchananella hordeovulneris]RRD50481.1 aldehyde dehydrogenase family protein [Buchananella hordeovulneris]